MKYPPSEYLGTVQGPDGQEYREWFRGEYEGTAALIGPVPPSANEVPGPLKMRSKGEVVHKEPATDPADAKAKLAAWRRANGWPV